jgi:hypothetical protein
VEESGRGSAAPRVIVRILGDQKADPARGLRAHPHFARGLRRRPIRGGVRRGFSGLGAGGRETREREIIAIVRSLDTRIVRGKIPWGELGLNGVWAREGIPRNTLSKERVQAGG